MQKPFAGVIGHEKILMVLERMMANETLPHAFLFVGPEGVGRTTVIKALLQALFEATGPLETIPDLSWVVRKEDPKTEKLKTQISVDQIRELTRVLSMSAMAGGWKSAVIEEADKMSTAGANALLKTLEEPKGKTLLFLRAPSVESVLETIASRCQVIRFYPVAHEEMVEGIVKKGFSRADVNEVVSQSLGRTGAAIRLLKDSVFSSQRATGVESMKAVFGATIPERLRAATDLVPKSEVNKRELLGSHLDCAEEVLRDSLLRFVGCEQLCMHGKALVKTDDQILDALGRLHDVRRSVHHNVNPHLALEHLFLSF
jgi:DNA polymerase III subunit delta'